MTTANETAHSFPPVEKTWADRLLIAGLGIYAFSSSFSIAASQIGLSLVLIAFIALYRAGKVRITSTTFDSSYAFLVLAGVLAIFRAENPLYGLMGLKTLLIVLCFYLVYWPGLESLFKTKLLGIMISSSVIVAIYAIITVYIGTAPGDRATGFFSMSLTFGECQAMIALLILSWFCQDNNSTKTSIILVAAFLIVSTAVFLSLQRGVWIGFVGGFVWPVLWKFKRAAIALILLLIILVPIACHHTAFLARLSGFSIEKTMELYNNPIEQEFEDGVFEANYLRPTTWTKGFQMTRDWFAFGVGHKNIKHWYEKLSSEYEHNRCFIFAHQHSNFMQVLAAAGMLGLIAFFYTIFSIIKAFYFLAGSDEFCRNAAISIFIAFILFGLTENAWGDEEVSMMAFFVTGLLMSGAKKAATQN